MATLLCFLWWILLGALLGWLASWLLGKSLSGPAPVPVERIVEKPVDRIVEKIVEKPVEKVVEKVVEKQVDNPAHLARIAALTGEVAIIAGLRKQIVDLEARPPKVVEKIVEKPVDRVVEKIVEKPVDRIVEKIVEKPVDRIVEKVVEKPVDRIVEKIVEKPVDRVVEKVVEKQVDNPAHLARIAALTGEVAIIAGLHKQIADLKAAPPKVVEKIVEKPVDRIVEKIVEKPVDRIVEKIVEKPVDRIVEKIVEKPVDRIVERVVEKQVPDVTGLAERDRRIADLEARIVALDSQTRDHAATIGQRDEHIRTLLRGPALDFGAAKAAGFSVKGEDNLEIIEGIGPKIADLLRGAGITTFRQLSETSPETIRGILDQAGPNFRIADPGTWPEQADLAARNRWSSLRTLQDVLDAGVRVDHASTAKDLRLQLADRDAQIQRLTTPIALDRTAAKEAGFTVTGEDDLEIIEGIGPKIADLLRAAGVNTFATLSRTTPAAIRTILDAAGPAFRIANPETWPEQSALAAHNQWRALKALQDVLNAGNR